MRFCKVYKSSVGAWAVSRMKLKFDPSKDIPALTGQVFLITGGEWRSFIMLSTFNELPIGTDGIGKETVRLLSQHEPQHVYFTGRNADNAKKVIEETKKITPTADVTFIKCDLASLDSVKDAAKEFTHLSQRLDVLILNAGIMGTPAGVTKDGYEVHFATNHLGHALLIRLLMPVLIKTSDAPAADVRIISVSSLAHKHHPRGGIQFETLRTPQARLSLVSSTGQRYGQSKLANIVYAKELARRYPQITSVSINPGIAKTKIIPSWRTTFLRRLAMAFYTLCGLRVKMVSPEKGAYNQVWAATTIKKNLVTGGYYQPIGVLIKPAKNAGDPELAKRLWEWTEDALRDYEPDTISRYDHV